MLHRIIALALVLMIAGCAAWPRVSPAPERPLVVLISIDGFRADYLDPAQTPTLWALAEQGASGPMRPSFPTVTFPNHYTLVTGLHPDHHGVVGNVMEDPALPGRFTMGNRDAVGDRRWWDQGEPIWVTAERAGLTTATMFWPGSEADVRGVWPSHWMPFDQSMPGEARVDQLLAWLDLPADRRPDLATLYFDTVDTAGHRHGPGSPEVAAAAGEVDAAIARLRRGLEARGLAERTVLLIVSDHGMAATSPDRAIHLDDLVPPDAVEVLYASAVASLRPAPGREAEVEAALLRPHPHMDCWRRQDIPARFVYGANPRVAPIFCLARTGWLIATRARPVRSAGGAHGYDNQAPEMQAIFIAHGPGVAEGVRLEGLDSVDVQPLLGRLLGIEVPAGDGDPSDTLAVQLRPGG